MVENLHELSSGAKRLRLGKRRAANRNDRTLQFLLCIEKIASTSHTVVTASACARWFSWIAVAN